MSGVNYFYRPQTIESSKHATKTLINRGDRIRTCDLVLPKPLNTALPERLPQLEFTPKNP